MDLFFDRFPQLTFEISPDTVNTDTYRQLINANMLPEELISRFKDEVRAEILTPFEDQRIYCFTFRLREDFEHAVRSILYRCEPKPIPLTTGAMVIFGVRNAEKVETELRAAGAKGEEERTDALRRLRALPDWKQRFTEAVFLISTGPYSNVPAEAVGMDTEEWKNVSGRIRLYHELSHVFSRRFYPEHKEAVRDEVIADAIGLLYAFGKYDAALGRRVIGIGPDGYMPGGRLENYVERELLPGAVETVYAVSNAAEQAIGEMIGLSPIEVLRALEEERIGML